MENLWLLALRIYNLTYYRFELLILIIIKILLYRSKCRLRQSVLKEKIYETFQLYLFCNHSEFILKAHFKF